MARSWKWVKNQDALTRWSMRCCFTGIVALKFLILRQVQAVMSSIMWVTAFIVPRRYGVSEITPLPHAPTTWSVTARPL